MDKSKTLTEFGGKKRLNAVCFGEVPETEFKNSYDAPRVQLMSGVSREMLYHSMFTFITGSFGNVPHKLSQFNPGTVEERQVIEACLRGEALPLALEIPVFTFKIWGIDRVVTHQIVRSRIGVTFSQHCTGDNDVRHLPMLLPHPFYEQENDEFRLKVEAHLIKAKELYAEALDKHGISIEDARHILPQCVDTYIFMHCNYMMLRNFVARRFCVNESPQMQVLCSEIKSEVTAQYPLLGKYLVGACEVTKRCHFKRNNSVFGGSVFYGCGKHPRKDSDGVILENDPKAYVHPGTANEYRKTDTEGTRHHVE